MLVLNGGGVWMAIRWSANANLLSMYVWEANAIGGGGWGAGNYMYVMEMIISE